MAKIKYLFSKLKEHHAELGTIKTIKWLFFAVRFRTLMFITKGKYFKQEGNLSDEDIDLDYMLPKKRAKIFIFSAIPYYDIGGGQRGAQLARTFNSFGYEVSYFFSNDSSESKIYSMEIPTVAHKNIKKYDINVFSETIKKNDLVIVEFPDARFIPFIEMAHKKKARIVYESIDNWETSLGNGIFDRNNLNHIIMLADMLVGTAKPLVKQLKRYTKELSVQKPIFYEPNAVNDVLFDGKKTYSIPKDMVLGEKTLIYYGSLWGEWFDWDLIYGIARRKPNYSIILIGEKEHLGEKVSNAPENVHFLGIKKQTDLPAYLAHSDYAMVPFKIDKIGEYVSPLKIFEYLSMEKTVLSTSLPEVTGYPGVLVGDTVEEWEKNLEKDCTIDLAKVREFISKNTWQQRCGDILKQSGLVAERCSKPFWKNINIVILNYNNQNCIFDCIDSLLDCSKRYKYSVTVIDNGSTDGSYEKLKDEYAKKITLLRNKSNGCSSGRNLGIKNTKEDYILFLDSDQFALHDYWLDAFLDLMENKKVGAIGWAAGWVHTKKKGTIVDYYPYRFMPANIIARSDIDYLGTGGMLIKTKTLIKIGMFDEQFDPTCYEDTDISFAVRDAGYNIFYSSYLGIYHLPHQTTKANGGDKHQEILRAHEEKFLNKWKNKNPDLFKNYKKKK